jgi:acyl-[acyl-carrier-protein] desaturase
MALTSEPRSTTDLLIELEPVVAAELDRHLSVAKEWFPHQYVPWSRGRDFDGPMGGEPWDPGHSTVPSVVREALVVNLLTEDNLPGYHREISTIFGRDGAWGRGSTAGPPRRTATAPSSVTISPSPAPWTPSPSNERG